VSRPAAVLWDLDGTLIDTEPLWIAAQTAEVTGAGSSWERADGLRLVGSALDAAARVLMRRGVAGSEWEIVDRLTDRVLRGLAHDVPWRPGARELVAALASAGVPMALVTMSVRRMADLVSARLGDPFACVVAGDEVARGKPDPEPYLLAARRLGVPIAQCVAIEDSPTGIASAVAAGARVFAVPLHVPIDPACGATIIESLERLTATSIGVGYSPRATTANGGGSGTLFKPPVPGKHWGVGRHGRSTGRLSHEPAEDT
jgi:HAD superfamily hydrolase (TIGR01509 family)